ncbi:cell wall-binding repeat-containing protein [Peptostreptococcus stomatis]|uniref:cell wall-binding repeat-containing protein n=1 Tax=Peptostreptococcus stomatis TaxID=341694 RepID=UPI003F9EE1FC
MIKLLKKSLFLLCSLALLLPSVASADMEIARIAGQDRYVTSSLVATNFFNSQYLIIASGEKYPDAIMGGCLSTQIKSPILLVQKNNIPDSIKMELRRFTPKKIFVLGGQSSISDSNIRKIKSICNAPILRVAGKDRYQTAHKIDRLRIDLQNLTEEQWDGITRHYIGAVSGENFYDALYAAPYIGLRKFETGWIMSLIFCHSVEDFMKESEDSVESLGFLIGDIKVLNSEGFYYPTIIKGRNRYETSAMIASNYYNKYILNLPCDTVVIVSGENYPDGLSAAGFTALYNAPILLTPKKHLDPAVRSFLKNNPVRKVIIVGGENSVSKSVEDELGHL